MVTFLFLGDQLKQFPKPLEAGDRANFEKKGWIFYPASNLDKWLVIWVNVPQK